MYTVLAIFLCTFWICHPERGSPQSTTSLSTQSPVLTHQHSPMLFRCFAICKELFAGEGHGELDKSRAGRAVLKRV